MKILIDSIIVDMVVYFVMLQKINWKCERNINFKIWLGYIHDNLSFKNRIAPGFFCNLMFLSEPFNSIWNGNDNKYGNPCNIDIFILWYKLSCQATIIIINPSTCFNEERKQKDASSSKSCLYLSFETFFFRFLQGTRYLLKMQHKF